jgi:hypothetical protein
MNAHDERISSFLDDAMPAAERSAFESELLDNAELRQQVIELRQLRQDVATLPRYSVTEGFAQRVVAAAVAAKANENANITPASQLKPKTIRRITIGGLAIAASVAIVLSTLAWINYNGPVDVAQNNPDNGANVVKQPAELNPALAPVFASLPNDGEALVLRIRSPKNVDAAQVLRETLDEQGVVRRSSQDKSTAALATGNAYRTKIGNDRSLPVASAAIYLEISPAELELALERLADPASAVKFVPEHKLAVAQPTQPAPTAVAQAPGTAVASAGEKEAVVAPGSASAETGDFMQELSARLFKLPQSTSENEAAPSVIPTPTKAPKGKVRVLILIENVQ